ncbi:unknown [Firmicutes bacterium CAG:552]|nr:unknown [Firmicutes bacterium CAG:552]
MLNKLHFTLVNHIFRHSFIVHFFLFEILVICAESGVISEQIFFVLCQLFFIFGAGSFVCGDSFVILLFLQKILVVDLLFFEIIGIRFEGF